MLESQLTRIVAGRMERRIWAAYKKQWQDKQVKIIVTSPQITYEEHFNDMIPKDLFINVMVGDLQRIREWLMYTTYATFIAFSRFKAINAKSARSPSYAR